jgi:hypothetical protein
MADRVLSNEFSIFIRKIGYSVGLEHTLDRIRDFANLYGRQDTLSYADINRLLHEGGWGLKSNNEHILDVLRSLEIVSVRKGEVGVLESGEALGILKRLEMNGVFDEFEAALRFIFAYALVRADGDIFLNALAACFDPNEFAARISRMIEHKWSVLEGRFRSKHHRSAIYRAVNIDVQENNPGSRGRSISLRMPLDASRLAPKRGSLNIDASRPDFRISEPYLTKALPRRKAWALSLGLAESGGSQTTGGRNFLEAFCKAGFGGPSCVAIWPLTHELTTPTFANLRLPADVPIVSSWDFFRLVGHALDLLPSTVVAYDKDEHEHGIQTLRHLARVYRSLNQSKSIMRVELPLRVAYRCVLSLSIGKKSVLPYPKIIEREQERHSPRVMARPSRVAELALSG